MLHFANKKCINFSRVEQHIKYPSIFIQATLQYMLSLFYNGRASNKNIVLNTGTYKEVFNLLFYHPTKRTRNRNILVLK